MVFNLEDISVMIASMLTIYEDGIYMPYTKILDDKYVVLIANKNNIHNINKLCDIDKYDDCFLLYEDDNLSTDIDRKVTFNYNNENIYVCTEDFVNYDYINDFISYIINNYDKNLELGRTISNITCDFLNSYYQKPKKRVK